MVLLDQRFVFRLDVLERRLGAESHHLQRLALGVEYLARLGLGLGPRPWARPPPAAAVEFAEHIERIDGAFEVRLRAALALFGAGVGAHLPGRTMAGERILLVARDRVRVHALEEII